MNAENKEKEVGNTNPISCESCKFNTSIDDEQMRCEFAKMLGKREPGCEKYEGKK